MKFSRCYGPSILPFTLQVPLQDLLGSISGWFSQCVTYPSPFPRCYFRWYVPVPLFLLTYLEWQICLEDHSEAFIDKIEWLVRSLPHSPGLETIQERSFYIGIGDAQLAFDGYRRDGSVILLKASLAVTFVYFTSSLVLPVTVMIISLVFLFCLP